MIFIRHAAAVLFALLICGCGDALPEVNDANCTLEMISKIKDKAAREKFAGQCSRLPRIAPTPKQNNWLDEKQLQK